MSNPQTPQGQPPTPPATTPTPPTPPTSHPTTTKASKAAGAANLTALKDEAKKFASIADDRDAVSEQISASRAAHQGDVDVNRMCDDLQAANTQGGTAIRAVIAKVEQRTT